MILRIPAYNPLCVCPKCWAASTPHNDGGLARVPYLRVPYCEHFDAPGDRIQSPLLEDDRFVLDGQTMLVKAANVEPDSSPWNEPAAGHSWVWVIEAEPIVDAEAFDQ